MPRTARESLFARLAQPEDHSCAPNLAFARLNLASSSCSVAICHSCITNVDSEREHFCLETTVRGHHIYKSTWTPHIGQILQTAIESGNEHDRPAVAVRKDNTVGHMPREISKVEWYFLQHGREIICEISGRRGPVFLVKGRKCLVHTFLGSPKMIKRLVKLFADSKA